MTNINQLKEKLRAKIKEKNKISTVEFKEEKEQIGNAVLGPIMLNMKPLEKASNLQAKEIEKQSVVVEANSKILTNLVEATKLIAQKTIELKETDKIEKEKDRKIGSENVSLLLTELKDIASKIREQGKFEKPTTINLGDVEDLLEEIRDKEMPSMPEMDTSKMEGMLEKIASKEPEDMSEIADTLENIYDVLIKAWLPSENALQVIVKNQIQSAGGGGIVPFKNSGNQAVKPLVGADGYLVTNQNNMLVSEKYDYISVNYFDTVTEIYSYYLGGSGGNLVATITLVYTDISKNNVSTVTKT